MGEAYNGESPSIPASAALPRGWAARDFRMIVAEPVCLPTPFLNGTNPGLSPMLSRLLFRSVSDGIVPAGLSGRTDVAMVD